MEDATYRFCLEIVLDDQFMQDNDDVAHALRSVAHALADRTLVSYSISGREVLLGPLKIMNTAGTDAVGYFEVVRD